MKSNGYIQSCSDAFHGAGFVLLVRGQWCLVHVALDPLSVSWLEIPSFLPACEKGGTEKQDPWYIEDVACVVVGNKTEVENGKSPTAINSITIQSGVREVQGRPKAFSEGQICRSAKQIGKMRR